MINQAFRAVLNDVSYARTFDNESYIYERFNVLEKHLTDVEKHFARNIIMSRTRLLNLLCISQPIKEKL